ncbi:hypothetical protein JTB14_004878 [Gonioctena quinquepunctata]|nr:hypothetical protein JTB14_004878 [Gonioctena quinquepunctata]
MKLENYLYVVQSRKRDGTQFLRCKFAKSQFCKGSGKITPQNEFVALHPHCHDPVPNVVGNFRKELVTLARSENGIGLRAIYDSVAQRMPEAAIEYPFPKAESTMRAARRRSLPSIPETFSDLRKLFLGKLATRYLCHGEVVHLITSEHGTTVTLHCQNLLEQVIGQIKELYFDGSFKVVPNKPRARQLLSVHGIIEKTSVTLFYALMESGSTEAYIDVLNYLKTVVPTLEPEIIISDFDGPLHEALCRTWPDADISGCSFDYAQTVWNEMAKLGYLEVINSNQHAQRGLKLLMSLLFLPSNKIEEGFEHANDFLRENDVNLDLLLLYISSYWLGTIGPSRLSVYGLPRRTNNNLESFHKKIKLKLRIANPNIWSFISEITKYIREDHDTLNQVLAGPPKKRQNRGQARQNQILEKAKKDLEGNIITIQNYCSAVSHSIDALEEDLRNWANNVGLPDSEDGQAEEENEDEDHSVLDLQEHNPEIKKEVVDGDPLQKHIPEIKEEPVDRGILEPQPDFKKEVVDTDDNIN